MRTNYVLAGAAGLLPGLVAAEVSCDFSVAPNSGDTCSGFASSWGLSLQKFKNLNPGVSCPDLDTSKNYCVIGTATGGSDPTPTTTTMVTTTTAAGSGHSPTLPGVVDDCDKWHKIVSGDQCDTIEKKYGISDNQFKKWNSELNDDCTNLWLGYYACVHIPGASTDPGDDGGDDGSSGPQPQMPGLAENCDKYHKVASGDQCDSIEKKYGISDNQFKKWNSELNDGCTNLWLGYYTCVHVPGASTNPGGDGGDNGPTPQMPGIVDNCNKFHKIVSGDNCYNLEQKYDITLKQFLKWNTEVNDACSNIWAGYYVCVGV